MRTYGLIGYPLEHSFSRRYFTAKFLREHSEEQYLNFELTAIGLLPDILAENPGLAGLNVTIPYKEKVIPLLDRVDPVARDIGAVNTLRIIRQGKEVLLEGFNTDVYGFTGSLEPLLSSFHTGALVLGSGGASKAVRYALDKLGIHWLMVSRNPHDSETLGYGELTREVVERYPVVVNTTPLGTFPHTETFPPVPYEWLTPRHLLFDLVYNPEETRFMAMGRERGAVVKNGYEMLVLQAERSYQIWNGLTLERGGSI